VKPLQSARITSNYAFKYGRVEVRAKLPRGNWIWPGNVLLLFDPSFLMKEHTFRVCGNKVLNAWIGFMWLKMGTCLRIS
jgi:hypothetical protein